MKNKFTEWVQRFFKSVESIPDEEPSLDDLVDGKAFAIKHYPLRNTKACLPGDKIVASINDEQEGEVFKAEEDINIAMIIDTVSIFRFNDALGYKHAVGAIFGQRKSDV